MLANAANGHVNHMFARLCSLEERARQLTADDSQSAIASSPSRTWLLRELGRLHGQLELEAAAAGRVARERDVLVSKLARLRARRTALAAEAAQLQRRARLDDRESAQTSQSSSPPADEGGAGLKEQLTTVTFLEPGSLGLQLKPSSGTGATGIEVHTIHPGTQASAVTPQLRPGMLLRAVQGRRIRPAAGRDTTTKEVLALIKAAGRPLVLQFAEPPAPPPPSRCSQGAGEQQRAVRISELTRDLRMVQQVCGLAPLILGKKLPDACSPRLRLFFEGADEALVAAMAGGGHGNAIGSVPGSWLGVLAKLDAAIACSAAPHVLVRRHDNGFFANWLQVRVQACAGVGARGRGVGRGKGKLGSRRLSIPSHPIPSHPNSWLRSLAG
jgi:hypothetical protein